MSRTQKAALAGALGMAITLSAVWWLSARGTASRREELRKETHLAARQFATRLRNGLEKHLIALSQLANFFENSKEVTAEEFSRFASATFDLAPGILRISAMDASYRVRWAYPRDAAALLVGFDVRTHRQGYETVVRAKETKSAVLSAPLKLVDGPQGFILAIPIFRAEVFQGAVVGTFRSSDFFSSIVLREVLERYDERVLSSGTEVFKADSFDSPEDSAPHSREDFALGGATWEVYLQPHKEVVLASVYSGQLAFCILGCFLAVGVGAAVGAGTYWASTLRTRLKTRAQALDETRERLDDAIRQLLQAEKMTALGELVAGVAHEINNPLCSVMGYAQLLLAKERPAEEKTRLETMLSESERMSRIVKNLLSFARKHPPEKKYLGLNGIVEKTLELKAYHFRVNQIQAEKDLATELPKTMLDFHQMQQVLLNLLNNAEQAMVEAGRRGRIQIRTCRSEDRIELHVSDDGPGIPLEIQHRIFEPFFTTKKEGRGTGLGLSLCYGIVKEHGGDIRAESEPGRGATFIVRLPIVQDAAAATDIVPVSTTRSLPRLRILVVDDEQSVQNFLVDILGSKGHKVDTASDVPEAVRKIRQGGYDLIISDMKMPNGSGKDIYDAVAKGSPRPVPRIVFVTGDGASEQTLDFLRERAQGVVRKPFKIEELESTIARAIADAPVSPALDMASAART